MHIGLRRWIEVMLCSALWVVLSGCQGSAVNITGVQTLDAQATQVARWRVGEMVVVRQLLLPTDKGPRPTFRRFLGVTVEGGYLVQDFYDEFGAHKFTDVFVLVGGASAMQRMALSAAVGHLALYDREGNPLLSGELDGCGRWQGELRKWYANGQLESKQVFTQKGERVSVVSWHANSVKDCEGQYADDRKDGEWQCWWDSGKLRQVEHYTGGRLHGLWQYWYPDGAPMQEGVYERGEKEGLWTSWRSDGGKEEEGMYEHGKRQGLWREWYADGARREGTYLNDEKDGLWQGWHANGVLGEEGEYRHGTRVGEWRFWDSEGDRFAYDAQP